MTVAVFLFLCSAQVQAEEPPQGVRELPLPTAITEPLQSALVDFPLVEGQDHTGAQHPIAVPRPKIQVEELPQMRVLGKTPQPTETEAASFNSLVQDFVDPQNSIDLVVGRPRLMRLKSLPTQTQIGNPEVAQLTQLGDARHLSLLGNRVGTTSMYIWFQDPENEGQETVLSFLVRVLPDPEEKERLERVYRQLSQEINTLFPNSHVEISAVGDRIAVRGQAYDIIEATQIMRIVRANAPEAETDDRTAGDIPVGVGEMANASGPGSNNLAPTIEDFLVSGGPNVINLLQVPGVQQVQLKVTVAEINRAAARSIGLNFAIDNDDGVTVFQSRVGNLYPPTGSQLDNNIGGLFTNLTQPITNNLPVQLDSGQVRLAINALRNMDYAKSLAEPNLVAINGQTASFQAGGQFPVPVIASNAVNGIGGALQGVSFVPYGVLLNFTPYVTERDRIRLSVSAEVSVRDLANGTQIGGGQVAALNTRNFQTMVELKEGQTLAVAGLLQNNSGTRSSRVPFFGDLPIAGRLFGYDQIQTGEQELVVLVTPELVNPIDGCDRPPLPGSDVYEPGDLEFYLLGRLESRREQDYRSPVRTDIHRMKAYHHCEELYIAGPHGHECETPVCPSDAYLFTDQPQQTDQ